VRKFVKQVAYFDLRCHSSGTKGQQQEVSENLFELELKRNCTLHNIKIAKYDSIEALLYKLVSFR
jgi:hypothetical protein